MSGSMMLQVSHGIYIPDVALMMVDQMGAFMGDKAVAREQALQG